MGDIEERLKAARQNVGVMQGEYQRIGTLLTKWQGVVEYLESLQAEKAQGNGEGSPAPEGETVRPAP